MRMAWRHSHAVVIACAMVLMAMGCAATTADSTAFDSTAASINVNSTTMTNSSTTTTSTSTTTTTTTTAAPKTTRLYTAAGNVVVSGNDVQFLVGYDVGECRSEGQGASAKESAKLFLCSAQHIHVS